MAVTCQNLLERTVELCWRKGGRAVGGVCWLLLYHSQSQRLFICSVVMGLWRDAQTGMSCVISAWKMTTFSKGSVVCLQLCLYFCTSSTYKSRWTETLQKQTIRTWSCDLWPSALVALYYRQEKLNAESVMTGVEEACWCIAVHMVSCVWRRAVSCRGHLERSASVCCWFTALVEFRIFDFFPMVMSVVISAVRSLVISMPMSRWMSMVMSRLTSMVISMLIGHK